MKIAKFLFFVLIIIISGCYSKPITQNIINDVGGNSEVKKFQYYVSTTLELTNTNRTREKNINKTGSASITETVYNDRIIISKSTMGAALESYLDDNNNLVLEICFEADDDKRITFKQNGPGQDRRFYLQYQNQFDKTIIYGEETYTVNFSGDQPYLMININRQSKEQTRIKWATGRRVQNE
jgi:hypothetical protein